MGIRERWGDLDAVRLDEFVPDAHTDIPRLRRGGVDVQFWAAYVPPRFRGSEATVVADQQIDLIHELTRRYPSDLELATSWSDVERARAAKKVASMIGVEGGHAIDESLDVLKEFYQRGARYLTLTHNRSLAWADAAGDQPRAGGLSAFGREVVAMMNELGMLVDLSHVTTRTMHDAIEVSAAPVIFSHSSARALVDHPRNVPDEVLARVPQNGGVVMVNFFSGFLTLEGAASVPGLFEAEEEIREAQAEPEGYRTEMEAWLEALAGTRSARSRITSTTSRRSPGPHTSGSGRTSTECRCPRSGWMTSRATPRSRWSWCAVATAMTRCGASWERTFSECYGALMARPAPSIARSSDPGWATPPV